jgi:hypothetical protein
MPSESFEIKSSYENINNLSKGEVIKNKKYNFYLEMLIQNYLNNINNNFIEENIKEMISKFSAFNNKKEISEKGNEDEYYSEKREAKNDNKIIISKNMTSFIPKSNKLSLNETTNSSNQIISLDKHTIKMNEKFYHTVNNGKKKSKFHEQIEKIVKKNFCSGEHNQLKDLPQKNEKEKKDEIINGKDINFSININYNKTEGNDINNNIKRLSSRKKEKENNNQNENNNNIILTSSANAIIEIENDIGPKNKLELLNRKNGDKNYDIHPNEINNKCIIV